MTKQEMDLLDAGGVGAWYEQGDIAEVKALAAVTTEQADGGHF